MATSRIQGRISTVTDDNLVVKNSTDNTKEMQFDVGNISPSTTRVVTIPDRDLELDKLDGNSLFEEITTPSSPSSGYNKLYFKNDDELYKLNSSGEESLIGGGGGNPSVTTKTGNYTATTDDDTIRCNGTLTITLPTAIGNDGKTFDIKNIGTGTVTIDGDGSQTIDGELSVSNSIQYDTITVRSNGSNWDII